MNTELYLVLSLDLTLMFLLIIYLLLTCLASVIFVMLNI